MPKTRLKVRISGSITLHGSSSRPISREEWEEDWKSLTEEQGEYQAMDFLESPDDVSDSEVEDYEIQLIEQTADKNGMVSTKVLETWTPCEGDDDDEEEDSNV